MSSDWSSFCDLSVTGGGRHGCAQLLLPIRKDTQSSDPGYDEQNFEILLTFSTITGPEVQLYIFEPESDPQYGEKKKKKSKLAKA